MRSSNPVHYHEAGLAGGLGLRIRLHLDDPNQSGLTDRVDAMGWAHSLAALYQKDARPLFWTRASSSHSSTASVGCCNYGLACGTAARNSVGCRGHAEFLVALHLGVQPAPVLRFLRFHPELRETMRQSTSEAQRQTDEKGSRSQREPDSIVSVCARDKGRSQSSDFRYPLWFSLFARTSGSSCRWPA